MRLYFIFLFLFVFIAPAFGYIDPGTGSILISVIMGLLMTALFALKGVIYRITGIFRKKTVSIDNDFHGKLVFYSEGARYWPVFRGVLASLRNMGVSYVYLSSETSDEGLHIENEYHEAHFLGNMRSSIAFLNNMQADVCVLTTPQLGIISLMRSTGVRHYCHILHAPADIHTYKKFAFDYFDSILCSGEYQIENIRQLERDRSRKGKMLFRTGCTLFDCHQEYSQDNASGSTVLVAPTWGKKSSLLAYSDQIISQLMDSGFKVIFRPHPQSFISDKPDLDRIILKFKDTASFILDSDMENRGSMGRADALVCDISGIVFDFTFIKRKPAVVLDSDMVMDGYEATDITTPNAVYNLISETGGAIIKDNRDEIMKEVLRTMNSSVQERLLDKYIFNYGNASDIAASQIKSLLR